MLEVKFETINDDLHDSPSGIAAVLREVANAIERGATDGAVRDANGNSVGRWQWFASGTVGAAPSAIVGAYDNGGESADRYTVFFDDGTYLALSADPTHPLGVSQWGEADFDPEHPEAVKLSDIPADILDHAKGREREACA